MGDASKINGLLRWLERIDNVDWVPPALVIVSAWQASPDELERALSGLERLASLLIFPYSQAQNFEFDVKKTKYFSAKGGVSSFPLTTQVLQETDWTPAVVERRQAALLALLEATWTG
jgi:hypothetical protein